MHFDIHLNAIFFSNPPETRSNLSVFLKLHFFIIVKSRQIACQKKRESRPGILEFLQVTAAGAQLALQRKLTDGLDDFWLNNQLFVGLQNSYIF